MGFEQVKLLLYQSDDGLAVVDVQLKDETVWLSQAQMTELFGRDQSVISHHVSNVVKENELDRHSNMQKIHIVNMDKLVALTLLIVSSDPAQNIYSYTLLSIYLQTMWGTDGSNFTTA